MMVFESFFDDAAIFPPGNAPLDVAVKQHQIRHGLGDGAYVGPLVCDVARLPQLRDLALRPICVAVVGRADELDDAVAGVAGSPIRVTAVEARGPVDELPDTLARSVAIEMPWGAGFEVPPGAVLKLRCGGPYVPTVDELAGAIAFCVEHRQPFKLTAGLHAAISTAGSHGFVNVMAALVAATRGDDPAPVLSAPVERIELRSLGAARNLFRSVGTCDIDQPLADLRALGLIG